jgi:fibronectin type 3 domain-containing protein
MPIRDLARFAVQVLEISGPDAAPQLDVFASDSRELVVLENDALAASNPGERLLQTLAATPWRGKVLALAVKAEGRNGRSAAFSNMVVLEVGSPPQKPANLRAQVEPDAVVLAWEPGTGAIGYRVLRSSAAEGSYREIGRATATLFRDSAVPWGQPHLYRVQSVSRTRTGEIEGALSEPFAVTPRDVFPPARPAGVRAVVGVNSVEVVWDYSDEPDVAGYRLRRGGSAESLQLLQPELLTSANYTDNGVQPGQTYVYAAAAVDANGNESELSETVTVTLP